MTDDQHGEGTPRGGSRWDPLPQGEYDDGATAFVELPEGGVDALLAADSPLAAPGHGYVPPQITVSPATTAGTDPAATGAWPVPGAPVDGAQWHDPHDLHDPRAAHQQGQDAGEQPYGSETAYGSGAPYGSGTPYGTDAGPRPHGGNDRFTYNPGTTGQWNFEDATATEAAPGHDVTGQWSIPVAGGDLPDESGEFTTSSLVEQWGGIPPATLPGGAPAPWATQAAGQPWDRQTPQEAAGQDQPGAGYPHGAEQGRRYDQGHGHAPEQGHGHDQDHGPGPGPMEAQGHGQPGAPGPASGYAAPDQEATHGGHLPPEADPAHGGHLPEAGPGEFVPGQPTAGHAPGEPTGPGHAAEPSVTGHAPEPSRYADPGAESPGFTDPSSEPSGYADDGSGRAGAVGQGPEPSGFPDHAPEDAGFADHPSEPRHFTGHGAEPSHFTGHDPEQTGAPGHGPDQTGVPGHGPDQAGAHAPEDYPDYAGPDAHAPDRPAPAAPAGHGAEQPYAEHPGELPEETAPSPEADAADSADAEAVGPAQGAQEASQSAPGPGESAEGAPGAAEGADGPAEPSAGLLPAMADAEAGPEAADAPGADGEAPDDPAPEEPAAAPHDAADTPDDPSAAPQDTPSTTPQEEHPLASYVLRVNGTDRPVTDAWIGESLLYVLRERLGLAGAKDGCSQGECGACNVQVDGRLVASCLVPAVTAASSEVRTVEGLAEDGQPSDVQRALARCGAVQCGFCVPGMAMTVHDLLEGNPAPTELETRQALCGNLCRCSGYRGVVDAVKEVVAEREAHAAPGEGDGDEPRIPHQAGPGAGGVNASAFGVAPEPHGPEPHSPEPHDQPYGQDGGQA
ncbi:2Fe-2S iron-sulfur cluster-binding protein [Streptomyces olindensis]|uniref:2Fe-2S iron-sulfur cluster-binding protein n=1 Tax=Streptomyces olindensis TaxID=358823 RepID=A0ABV2Y641_9ACTN